MNRVKGFQQPPGIPGIDIQLKSWDEAAKTLTGRKFKKENFKLFNSVEAPFDDHVLRRRVVVLLLRPFCELLGSFLRPLRPFPRPSRPLWRPRTTSSCCCVVVCEAVEAVLWAVVVIFEAVSEAVETPLTTTYYVVVLLWGCFRGRRGCFLLRNLPRLRHFSLRRSYLIIKLSRKRGAFKWHKACLVTKKGFAHFGSNESRKDCLKMFTTIIDLYFFVHSVWPDVAANSSAQFSQKVATVVFYMKVINSKWPKTLLNNLGNKTRKSIFPPILGINSLRS